MPPNHSSPLKITELEAQSNDCIESIILHRTGNALTCAHTPHQYHRKSTLSRGCRELLLEKKCLLNPTFLALFHRQEKRKGIQPRYFQMCSHKTCQHMICSHQDLANLDSVRARIRLTSNAFACCCMQRWDVPIWAWSFCRAIGKQRRE